MPPDPALPLNVALDPTFRGLDSTGAAKYATFRPGYSSNLYDVVTDYHSHHGGAFEAVLDVGCGTGSVTRATAAHLDKATGTDPGEAMISNARTAGGRTKSGNAIEYEVRAAEDIDQMPRASVDLLAAAMAAHWFHMDRFWHAAAAVVKRGGTVALWTRSSLFCHPDTPNADAVQRVLSHLEDSVLAPFELAVETI